MTETIERIDLSGLTKEAVSAELDRIQEELGADWKYREHYEVCRYGIDGQPACLVGRIFAALAPEYYEHITGDAELNFTRIDNPTMASSVYMDSKLLKSLRGLQRHQDSSRSIAECREVSGL